MHFVNTKLSERTFYCICLLTIKVLGTCYVFNGSSLMSELAVPFLCIAPIILMSKLDRQLFVQYGSVHQTVAGNREQLLL